MELENTIELMQSTDYKDRFKAEYYQLTERYKKLKEMLEKWNKGELNFTPDSPMTFYNMQIKAMTDYKTALELRAEVEDIKL